VRIRSSPRRVNAIRRGCQVFEALFTLGNATAAFLVLTEHVRIQARLEPGAVPNYSELKKLYNVPLSHPDVGLAERLEAQGLHWQREAEIMAAVAKEEAVFKGLARCLRDAVRVEGAQIPSTKGVL
jgi:hypothetical protein